MKVLYIGFERTGKYLEELTRIVAVSAPGRVLKVGQICKPPREVYSLSMLYLHGNTLWARPKGSENWPIMCE